MDLIVIPDKIKGKTDINSECELLGIMMTKCLQVLIHGVPGTQKHIRIDIDTVRYK